METRYPQHAISSKCFHPSGSFTEFSKDDVEQSIPSRFEKIVRNHPDQVAIQTAHEVWTYTELNAMANRLARAIQGELGTEPQPIGLLFEKGPLQTAAMLGVLKAGMFFVLLDPSFPQARLSAVLEQSQTGSLVSNRCNLSLAKQIASRDLRLMEFESINSDVPNENLCFDVAPEALAFITYTSGSTGQPKGVIQNHRNILHDTMLRTNAYHICEKDRGSVLASGTSNAIKNAFLILLNGATLFPFDVQKEGAASLARWLGKVKISLCRMSSPLFRRFCECLTGDEKFPELRVMLLSSETIYRSDVELYKKYFSPNCVLVTGVASSESGLMRDYLIDHETNIVGNEVPVGYAVEGKDIFLLDDSGREIGFNEVGEIAVRSRYTSPGYWQRPDLTQAKWIPDPNGGEERVYLTGDLGFMRDDGCLIHKGRKDFRVKIRGYGVEIGEVEKALLEHAAVREAIVMARQTRLDEACLVAYLTAGEGPAPSVSELLRFLKQKLPDYMIPTDFVMLDKMPMTSSGKIDRQAMPEPDNSRPQLDTSFVPATNPVEKELVQIWAEVLSLDEVGVHDNFFDLGGHSLAATQVLSRIIRTFEVELSLNSFFQEATVAKLAQEIMRRQGIHA